MAKTGIEVLGLDPSWNSFGFCYRYTPPNGTLKETSIPLTGSFSLPRKDKYTALQEFKNQISKIPIWRTPNTKTIIVIEDYSYGIQHTNSLTAMGELRTIVELGIRDNQSSYYFIAPTALKKFATGKGNSQKAIIMQQVLKRWGFEARNEDIADAFVLAQIGIVLGEVDIDSLTHAQLEVIAKITDTQKS